MRTIIFNGKVISHQTLIPFGGVTIDDGIISSVFSGEPDELDNCRSIDADGLFISPGFIDTHIHGGGGADVMDGTAEAVLHIAKIHEKYGLTSFVPTTLTASGERISKACAAIREAQSVQRNGATILGIHLEGPFISTAYKGAQNPEFLLKPSIENYLGITGGGENVLRVSMAPELNGAFELARYLADKKILCSVAHSQAGYKIMREAADNGFSHITHMFNGMSGLTSPDYYCQAGVIESALELDSYSAEVICDGCHMPPEMIRLLIKCKKQDRVMLTSDATCPTDMPPGIYDLGGLPVLVSDGVAMLTDRSSFAGSIATADRLVRNAVHAVGLSMVSAVNMLSYNVAKSIGLDHEIGSLDIGFKADVLLFDENVDIKLVIHNGQITYNSGGFSSDIGS